MTGSNNIVELPPVFILVGGLGTRLKSISQNSPKALVKTKGVPFLEIQIQWLSKQGFQKIILLTGHKSEKIASFVRSGTSWNVSVEIICEETPLGTGGAILNALQELKLLEDFLLLNGDSMAEINLRNFSNTFRDRETAAMVIGQKQDASRFGKVDFDQDNKLICFHEKSYKSKPGWVNAGIYFFPSGWFDQKPIKPSPSSLEKDLIPDWLNQERVFKVHPISGRFIDIGTPESYSQFKQEIHFWESI